MAIRYHWWSLWSRSAYIDLSIASQVDTVRGRPEVLRWTANIAAGSALTPNAHQQAPEATAPRNWNFSPIGPPASAHMNVRSRTFLLPCAAAIRGAMTGDYPQAILAATATL